VNRRLLTIARAEWIHNLRDPRSLFVVVALPVLLLLLYGYGINYDVDNVPFAVYDLDGTKAARTVITRLQQNRYFELVAAITHRREIGELMDRADVAFVLVIPPDLGRTLGAGRPATVQVILDGADTTRANIALGYIQAALLNQSSRITIDVARRQGVTVTPAFTVHPTILYNPGLGSTQFIVPGLIAIILTLLAGLLTSTCIVREREAGSFEALVTSPARAGDILIGKMIPYAAISFVDVLLAIGTGALVFHVVPKGSFVLLLSISFLFLVASLAIGVLYSTLARTQQIAILLAILTTLLPTVLLSGFAFPLRSMPMPLRVISQIIPATHFLIIIRGIYLKQATMAVLWPRVLVLLGMTVGLVAIAARKFKKKL